MKIKLLFSVLFIILFNVYSISLNNNNKLKSLLQGDPLRKNVIPSANDLIIDKPQTPKTTTNSLFANFMTKYKKKYTASEMNTRLKNFQISMDLVTKHNAIKSNTYKLAINKFADMTDIEFNSIYLKPYKMDKSKAVDGDAYYGSLLETEVNDIKSSIDHRNSSYLNPIDNQGECGSCYAFSSVTVLETRYNMFKKLSGNKKLKFSRQQILDCQETEANGCEGGSYDIGLYYAQDNNMCLDKSYPYKEKSGTCNSSVKTCPYKKIVTGVHRLNFQSHRIGAMTIVRLLENGPVAASLYVENSKGFRLYDDGIYHLMEENKGRVLTADMIDHAVTIVGYGTANGHDYWIVRNTWGDDWGIKGYFYIKRGENTYNIEKWASVPFLD